MKAIAMSNVDDKSTADGSDGSPIYEEIPFDSKVEACGGEKFEEAQLELPRCENAYTAHPGGAELEGNYDCPTVHDPDGSIKDGDIYIEGASGVPETIHFSFARQQVYYNTSFAKKGQTALAAPVDYAYDVPKSNAEAPKEVVAAEINGQPLEDVECTYEEMHALDSTQS